VLAGRGARAELEALTTLLEGSKGMGEPQKAPRCPLCCEHGILLVRNCGWCENDYDPDHLADAWLPEEEPMWLCPHGIGVEPERRC
jgi:hypothetical protein